MFMLLSAFLIRVHWLNTFFVTSDYNKEKNSTIFTSNKTITVKWQRTVWQLAVSEYMRQKCPSNHVLRLGQTNR
jgi:hypothetical protein